MKQIFTYFFSLLLLFTSCALELRAACSNPSNACITTNTGCCLPACCGGPCATTFVPRPQYSDTAAFWAYDVQEMELQEENEEAQNEADTDTEEAAGKKWGFGFDTTLQYQRSFMGQNMAQVLCGTDLLQFQGSAVPGRNPCALIADNFGLSQNCVASVALKPVMWNINLNVHSHYGLDPILSGLYADVSFAFTHSSRTMGMQVAGGNCGLASASNANSCNNCAVQNCSLSAATNCAVATSTACFTPFPAGYMAAEAAATVPSVIQALQGQTLFGDMQTPWSFGKFATCPLTQDQVSGVTIQLGWNFWNTDRASFGGFFQYVAPTGNKPNPAYIFSPVAGNGKIHMLGGGINTSYTLWKNRSNENESFSVSLNGNVMASLTSHQVRSFDFCGKGCMSRYMLLEAINPSTNAYAGSLINGINFATRGTDVRQPVSGDATLQFSYNNGIFSMGFGYNIFGQQQEKCKINCKPVIGCNGAPVLDPNVVYGFKGCANLYTGGIPLSPAQTESNATSRHCGTVDVPTPNIIPDPSALCANACASIPNCATTKNCGRVCLGDLDVSSGQTPTQISHKGLINFNWNWSKHPCSPSFSFGGEAEGGTCATLRQWAVYVTAGFSF